MQLLLHFSNIRDGAEVQFVQCSTAQFESAGAERIISAPGSRGHGRIFPVMNRGFNCPHKSVKATSEKSTDGFPSGLSFSYAEGEEEPDYKPCLHVVPDPRYKTLAPIRAQREIAARDSSPPSPT